MQSPVFGVAAVRVEELFKQALELKTRAGSKPQSRIAGAAALEAEACADTAAALVPEADWAKAHQEVRVAANRPHVAPMAPPPAQPPAPPADPPSRSSGAILGFAPPAANKKRKLAKRSLERAWSMLEVFARQIWRPNATIAGAGNNLAVIRWNAAGELDVIDPSHTFDTVAAKAMLKKHLS
mmetsp:Transcript_3615/g.12918  ORF Transcript_3615/g.12918 Transcript_3615/m.12918 type:complete len:182 (+) Transcript_3615:509-1054(+)